MKKNSENSSKRKSGVTESSGSDQLRRDHSASGSSGRSNVPPSRHLWVGNLSHGMIEPDLTDHFLKYGELESVAFQPGRSYAFVNFKNVEGAISAMKALQGFTVAGNPLRIEFGKAEEEVCGGGHDGGVADCNGDYDNFVVLGSFEEVDRRAAGNHASGPTGDCIVGDWLEGEFCISCNRGGGQVLVCSENGCPVAMHKVCMNCEPKFDDMGKFYCPYCWYKQKLARTKDLRRKAVLAKKELSNFCLKKDGGIEEKKEDETEFMKAASVSTMAGKINSVDCENGLNDDGNETIHYNLEETLGVESINKEKSDLESHSKTRGLDNVGGDERIEEEDIENASDSEDDGEDRWHIQRSNPSILEIVKDTFHLSTKENSDTEGVSEEKQGKRVKEESLLPNAVGNTMALVTRNATSKVSAIESFEFVSPDLDIETLLVHQKCFRRTSQKARPQKVDSSKNPSFQSITGAKDKKMNQQGNATTGKHSVQCQESSKQLMIPVLDTAKRRRLYWRAEEEDMLKEGVRRFSTTMNKNIPWRKILEFGHHVFDTTRTPVDLKDKWKNITAKDKEAPESNRGALITYGGIR
ncbi:hypothetical protein DITRI_Ditri13aG0129900 [Diplodiscus trichospermus]